MESPIQQQSIKPGLKLYIYGSRQSDQFWIPTGQAHTRKPFCLTDLEYMENEDADEANKKVPNLLFKKNIFKIACGGLHSVVLTTEGQVFTFGCNDEGALGRKGVQSIPARVNLEDPVDLISAGDNHSMFANSANGAIYFSGNYNYLRGEKMTESIFEPVRIYASEINHNLKNKKIKKIASGHNHSVILVDGSVFCKGEPEAFTTGRRMSARHKVQNSLTFNGVNLPLVVDIQCGGYHTIAKVKKASKYKYYVWGKNDRGQLGIGSYEDQNYPVQLTKLRNKNIIQMAAGTSFSLFLQNDGQVYGCGSNQYGGLGLGEDYIYEDSGDQGALKEQKSDKSQSRPKQTPQKQQPQPIVNNQNAMIDQGQNNNNKISIQNNENNEKMQQKAEQKNENQLHEIKMNNIYIKSIRNIQFPEPINQISAGSEFAFGWNQNNLYSWGFGMSYVLLNGQQEDEYTPFEVKHKIINQERIHYLSAGGQHVMYTAYDKQKGQFVVEASEKIWQNLTSDRKLARKKK